MTIVFGTAILGAGSSRRMGQSKLLLPWGNTSIIGQQIALWRDLGASQIAVVHRPEDQALLRELDRLEFPAKDRVANVRADEGMFSSVRCAAAWTGWNPELTHWVIALGDQPHLKDETLRNVLTLSVSQPEKVCQPAYLGRARHPVILPARVFRRLVDCRAANLKGFLAAEKVATVDVQDPGLDLDIDEQSDYAKALQ